MKTYTCLVSVYDSSGSLLGSKNVCYGNVLQCKVVQVAILNNLKKGIQQVPENHTCKVEVKKL